MNANDVLDGETTDDSDAPSGALNDAVFAALADERRRTMLRMLARRAEPVAVADLARCVASADRQEAGGDHAKRRYVEFVHVHVPQLVDADLVEYDRRRNAVEGTEKLAAVHRALEAFERRLAESR